MSLYRSLSSFFNDWRVNEDSQGGTVDPEILSAIKKVQDEVGGDHSDRNAVKSSFSAILDCFDRIPSVYFEDPNKPGFNILFSEFLKDGRSSFLDQFTKKEEHDLMRKINEIKSLDTERDWEKHANLMLEISTKAERFMKINKFISGQLGSKTNEDASQMAAETSLKSAMETSKRGMGKVFELIHGDQKKKIEDIPEDEDGLGKLNRWKDLLEMIGAMNELRNSVAAKESKIDEKAGRTYRRDWAEVKRIQRVANRLIDAVVLAKLPAISNDKIEVNGDYFKLFTKLTEKQAAWMDNSVDRAFVGNKEEKKEFLNRAGTQESPLEEDQLSYLTACKDWIWTYIKVEGKDVLIKREEDKFLVKLNTAVSNKTKQIKNFYLSRDFNLNNFDGLRLNPEIKLPLYVKVDLPVDKAERVKDSILSTMLGGLKKVAGGIFGAITDKGDESFAKSAAARNKAVFAGISAMVKAGVITVKGKQAGREYAEKVDKPIFGTKKEKVSEDVVPSVDPTSVNPEAPVPPVKDNMDTMSLAGPQRKKKPKKEDRKEKKSRVSGFDEFFGSKKG